MGINFRRGLNFAVFADALTPTKLNTLKMLIFLCHTHFVYTCTQV